MLPMTSSYYGSTMNIPVIGGFSPPATGTNVEEVWEKAFLKISLTI